MVREPEKIPRFMPLESFAAIYEACDHAALPDAQAYSAADWWHGLLMFLWMTGWRIGEPLALRRDDTDLERAVAITRAADNKGKRDEAVPLHPVVVEHLRKLVGFSGCVFPWPHSRRKLYDVFYAIQKEAGIHLFCTEEHEHTDACHLYSFHDLRRSFATLNRRELKPTDLQSLMRHRSFSTTLRYINMGSELDEAVASLRVPDLRKSPERTG